MSLYHAQFSALALVSVVAIANGVTVHPRSADAGTHMACACTYDGMASSPPPCQQTHNAPNHSKNGHSPAAGAGMGAKSSHWRLSGIASWRVFWQGGPSTVDGAAHCGAACDRRPGSSRAAAELVRPLCDCAGALDRVRVGRSRRQGLPEELGT